MQAQSMETRSDSSLALAVQDCSATLPFDVTVDANGNVGQLLDGSDGTVSYRDGGVHYLLGDGDVTIPFSTIDPGWDLSGFGIDPCDFDVGAHEIDKNKIHETLFDRRWDNGGPGQVVIIIEGQLEIFPARDGVCKSYSFVGSVHSKPDEFNFDRRNRGFPREQITTAIRTFGPMLGGEDFWVRIEGSREVQYIGPCDCD